MPFYALTAERGGLPSQTGCSTYECRLNYRSRSSAFPYHTAPPQTLSRCCIFMHRTAASPSHVATLILPKAFSDKMSTHKMPTLYTASITYCMHKPVQLRHTMQPPNVITVLFARMIKPHTSLGRQNTSKNRRISDMQGRRGQRIRTCYHLSPPAQGYSMSQSVGRALNTAIIWFHSTNRAWHKAPATGVEQESRQDTCDQS